MRLPAIIIYSVFLFSAYVDINESCKYRSVQIGKGIPPLVLTRIFRSTPVNTGIIQGHTLFVIQLLHS
jgi:hypothetical protein